MPEENCLADCPAKWRLCFESESNQGKLHEDVATYFTSLLSPKAALVTVDGGHGRIETRTLRVANEIAWLKERHAWVGLKSIIAVTATRESGNKVTDETRYFISSLSADNPAKLEHAVRAHWAIDKQFTLGA